MVVVEARERSGALITADFALEEGREVFAVPGEVTSALSAGSNELLRLGATPLLSPDDVLSSLGLQSPPRTLPDLEGAPALVLAAVRDGAAAVDDLVARTGIDAGRISAALSSLELEGLVDSSDGLYRTTA